MCKPKAVAGKSPDEPAVQRAVDLKGVPRDYSHASLTVSPGTTGMSVQRAVSLTSGSCYSSEAMVFFFFPSQCWYMSQDFSVLGSVLSWASPAVPALHL